MDFCLKVINTLVINQIYWQRFGELFLQYVMQTMQTLKGNDIVITKFSPFID